ncbi:NADH-quinone oxidoreductase subunit C [Cohnella candidum]|uniref:NADH-quinone oxidoreductase subunit C n=1 Tax=Cohnella candidum TaxID=2674991 RepID=A0A3G3K1A1_9BACL|nr:NADH-quinone oxidoreductase subunit C [Cohnella candidum]AYQ74202.1 NADH-quinone oxidoreductase subunit C [Cohnella candidum]
MSDEPKRENEAGAAPEQQPATPAQEQPQAEAPAEAQAHPQPPAETPAQAPAEPPAAETAPAAPAAAGESGEAAPRRKETDEEKAARRAAALAAKEAAKAAAAMAKAAEAAGAPAAAPAAAPASAEGAGEAAAAPPPPPKPPSPNQPRLDRAVALLRELVAEDAVEEASINELNDHLPTLVVKNDRWAQAARLFLEHEELACRYLRNVSGVDYETYMEVVYYPLNMERRETYCIKVRTDREQPAVPSATPVWETANWNEREIYDLLGIDFPGHPNMTRIMMPDDWVGHPLRKDYVPLDPEV